MRVARLEIENFKGFKSFTLVPQGSVVVVGEPRAGRSDVIDALRRVLDPRMVRARPNEWDIHRPYESDQSNPDEMASVRVSLMDLSPELEQELDARMELLDPGTGLLAVGETSDEGELGIRLAYHLHYKPQEQVLEHWVEYPSSHHRLPLVERDALRAVVVEDNPPLQLRPEGTFRRIAAAPDPDALNRTLEEFAKDIAEATDRLTNSGEVQDALGLVANQGTKWVLPIEGDSPASAFGFTAEDGSMAALLRAVQPTLELDADVGRLPLASHGSTTRAVLAAAEASAVAHTDHAIVLADDFGDQLDASATEYLASRLQRRQGQLWLSTRRPEAVSAFEATDLLRLTRHEGSRQNFQLLPTGDRKERVRRRYLSTLLAPAMSARAVVILEGPHDLEAYTALDRRRHRDLSKRPFSACGMRLVCASASGHEGGKSELPKLAQLADDLGFEVRVVLDGDKPGSDQELIDDLRNVADLIVRLPPRTAVEEALLSGLAAEALRPMLESLNDGHDLGIDVEDLDDVQIHEECAKALKRKGGLHPMFVDLLPEGVMPDLATRVLQRLKGEIPPDPLVELDP